MHNSRLDKANGCVALFIKKGIEYNKCSDLHVTILNLNLFYADTHSPMQEFIDLIYPESLLSFISQRESPVVPQCWLVVCFVILPWTGIQ